MVEDKPNRTIREAVEFWAEAKPDYFVNAAEHRYGCPCVDCLVLTVRDGLDLYVESAEDPDWVALRGERLDGYAPTEDQVERLYEIADRYLR